MHWYFDISSSGYDIQGIRDSDISIYDRRRYESVVRESIQNSIDANKSDEIPVVVEFEFMKIQKADFENLFHIEERLKACSEWDKNTYDDTEVFQKMLSEVTAHRNEVEVLRISDYNTIGMEHNGNYESFARARNISNKQSSGSAGSKGVGKAAYFSLSYLRSILVSSQSINNNHLFQGICRLSTHNYNGTTYYYKGFFGYEDFKPILRCDLVPQIFRRNESGTSIFIIGLWNDEDRANKMVKAILNNFWLSIYDNRLIVKINNKEINHSNVYEEITQIWRERDESGHFNVKGNPRPYIETYMEHGIHRVYRDKLDILGNVKLVFSKHQEYPGRISYFRKSRMVIEKKTNIYKGYCGVFLCDDDSGNVILKKLENERHDQWDAGNWKDPQAKEAIKELNSYIENSFKDFVGDKDLVEITIPTLSDFINLSGNKEKKETRMQKGQKKKGLSKPVVISPSSSEDDRQSPNKITSTVKLDPEGKIVYVLNIRSDHQVKDVNIEVFVSSDNDRITADNKIPIKSTSRGSFVNNKITVDLDQGNNNIEITLDDSIKHSIRFKQVEA